MIGSAKGSDNRHENYEHKLCCNPLCKTNHCSQTGIKIN